MTIGAQTATVTGYYPSHVSKKLRVFGLLIFCKELAYKATVTREPVEANAREAIGYTIGTVKYEMSFTTYLPQWGALKKQIRNTLGVAPLDAQGTCVMTTEERGYGAENVTAKVAGLDGPDVSSSGGAATEVKVNMTVLTIFEDGKPLIERCIFDAAA
jgi:hypothetical protein